MSKLKNLDVLIVYNGTIATSAADSLCSSPTPFPPGSRHESCNTAYAYFLKTCAKQNLTAAFSTSADIVGPGQCSSYWTFTQNKWHKTTSTCSSLLIFDKFSPKNKSDKILRNLLFSTDKIKPFNGPQLRQLFFDKQKTYDMLSEHSIPTISFVGDTLKNINVACDTLSATMSAHSGNRDFTDDLIMKDRYGAGGLHVYKFKAGEAAQMLEVTSQNSAISFVLQPFAKFDQGFSYDGLASATDIRLIYLGGTIIESYIRVAKKHDFRCNQHQGGTLSYLSPDQIPPQILSKANAVIAKLPNKDSLYSLDFIISNRGNAYLLEGNTGPGLDWNTSVKQEEINAKKFIRAIVKELGVRPILPATL